MKSITLKPEISELYTLNEFILDKIPQEDFRVNLIVEEIFVNIVNYSKAEYITVSAEFSDNTLTMEFVDNGIEFNPLLNEDPSLPDTIEEVKIGGLGIFLTKQMADELDYRHINGENHLRIIKNVE